MKLLLLSVCCLFLTSCVTTTASFGLGGVSVTWGLDYDYIKKRRADLGKDMPIIKFERKPEYTPRGAAVGQRSPSTRPVRGNGNWNSRRQSAHERRLETARRLGKL